MIKFSTDLLPDKNVRRKRKHERRGHTHKLHTIKDRPKIVNKRLRLGDWEVDTVLSSYGESKECIATFVERKTRLLWAMKIPNRTHQAFAWAMRIIHEAL